MPGHELTSRSSEPTKPPSGEEAKADLLSPAELPFALHDLLEMYKNEAHRVCNLARQGRLDSSASSYEALKEDLDEGDYAFQQYLVTFSFGTGADALKAYMDVLFWATPASKR